MLIKPKHIAVAAVIAAVIAFAMTQKDTKWQEKFPARSMPASKTEEPASSNSTDERLPDEETESLEEEESIDESSELEESIDEQSKDEMEQQPEESKEQASAKQTGEWNLLLVNSENTIDQTFKPELADVQNGYQMDKRAAEYAKRMIKDAKAQGVDLLVCSGYRSYESQNRNFNNYAANLQQAGYSKDEAVKETSRLIAYPGSSEHQTGLALDIVTPTYQGLNDGYADTAAAKWLYNNAADYGFILRYPKDKEDITKISFEPWHYRYVGEEAAREIMDQGICLEEYLSE